MAYRQPRRAASLWDNFATSPVAPLSQRTYAAPAAAAPAVQRRVLAIDTETTGLGQDRRMLELAAVDESTGEVVYHQRYNPGVPSHPAALRVHGLTSDVLAQHEPLQLADAEKIAELLGPAVLLAHNLVFDIGTINLELRAYGLEIDGNTWIDTGLLTKKDVPDSCPDWQTMPSLDAAAQAVGLPARPAGQHHDAVTDARLCMAVYKALCQRAARSAPSAERAAPVSLDEPRSLTAAPVQFIRTGALDGGSVSMPGRSVFYYNVLYTKHRARQRRARQYQDGVLEVHSWSGRRTARLVLRSSQNGGTLVETQWIGHVLGNIGDELQPVGPYVIEIGDPMSEAEYHSGAWSAERQDYAAALTGRPVPTPAAVAPVRPAVLPGTTRPETARAVHAVRTIGAGRQPTRALGVADLQRAIRTEYVQCQRLVRERDNLEGRVHELETQADYFRGRLSELAAVAELLEQ